MEKPYLLIKALVFSEMKMTTFMTALIGGILNLKMAITSLYLHALILMIYQVVKAKMAM
jgi:hypothetical protein